MTPGVGKLLMFLAAILFGVGAAAYLNLLPWFGRLPGDIAVKKGSYSFYFPIVTCLIVSVILTLLARFFRR